jgi:diadenosine tetraphosphate (Ap4A) HIT family hydrolase
MTSYECFVCEASVAQHDDVPWYDVPVLRGSAGVAILGTGAIAPGYLLLCPTEHVHSLAALPKRSHEEFVRTVGEAERALQATFGPTVLFEHGGCTTDARRSQCVTHAHLHVWSVADRVTLRSPQAQATYVSLSDFLGDAEWLQSGGYLLHSEGDLLRVSPDPGVPQYFRRQVAEQLGRPYEWDYAAFMFSQNMMKTRDLLCKGL